MTIILLVATVNNGSQTYGIYRFTDKKTSNNLYHNITNLLIAIRRLMTNIRCKYSS